jgi:glycosyltransferase involved in cell wall biosynthesis
MSVWPTVRPTPRPVVGQGFSGSLRFGILSTFPPTLCGLAFFSVALADGLTARGANVSVVRVSDGLPSESTRVIGELVNGSRTSAAACVELLNHNDVAVIQYGETVYGGVDGEDIMDVLAGLQVPSIVIAHTVPELPKRRRRVFERVVASADRVVVMSEAAHRRLCSGFDVDRRKVVTITHGSSLPPPEASGSRCHRPSLVTWGLMGPGKGVERVIDAMGSLRDLPGRPRYLVAGRTHPEVLAAEGEAYRDARVDQARRSGVADSVHFDAGYRNGAMLTALAQSAAVVVLPYDSRDQVTSGVLVDAIANGRPVVATAFPHAVELLSSGAGIVVGHDDPDALASALRRVLTQPRLAGEMAAEARRLAPEMAWPVVASAYLQLAGRLLAQRRAAVP